MMKHYTKQRQGIIVLAMLLFFSATSYCQNIYVDQNVSGGSNDGTSWANAFVKVTEAITVASDGNTIFVAKGTYVGDASSTAFTIGKSLTISGGFPTGGGTQDIANNETILDGSNARRVLNVTKGSTLNGLTIQNGKEVDFDGAGIRFGASSTIDHCIIKNNICEKASDSEVLGGGIWAAFNLVINNSQIISNTASSTSANAFSAKGGGVYVLGTLKVFNSLFLDNSATSTAGNASGGGLYVAKQSEFYNSLITKNKVTSNATSDGAGLYASGTTGSNSKAIRLRNSIMWENSASTDGGSSFASSEYSINGPSVGFFTAINSLVDGEFLDAEGSSDNINDSQGDFDPMFTDKANNDYTLQATSALINAGLDTFNDTTTDLAGNARIFETIDIGPYEFQSATASVDDNSLNSITVYPNPATNFIKISGNLVDANYSIFSLIGQKVKAGKVTENTINITDLSTGNYILKVSSEKNTITRKIIIN